ncbi:Error-prone repair protein ImuA [Pedobacter nyackensis]|uniref:ImuA family protein n=1 Tax=Pedobacter nyackensis TaxID=475255 RepID=UPI00292EA0C3|nr:Error-prone repair protein ImuA [Pedobacter nyackensis]
MVQQSSKKEIISQLQKEIHLLQGFKSLRTGTNGNVGLGTIESAFPNSVFPKNAIHEFLTLVPEHAAACNGFIGGILHKLMKDGGACLWISASRSLFPPSLKLFGVEPDRIIFIDLQREKDVLWAMEEALKCEGLAAVIAEVREISLTASRRLQLAVEKSGVTGLVLRNDANRLSATACVARWQIKPIASQLEDHMPGVGFPRWNVELLKVRNGNPGKWDIEWSAGQFRLITKNISNANGLLEEKRNVG